MPSKNNPSPNLIPGFQTNITPQFRPCFCFSLSSNVKPSSVSGSAPKARSTAPRRLGLFGIQLMPCLREPRLQETLPYW